MVAQWKAWAEITSWNAPGDTAQRVMRDVRDRLFTHLESLPIRYYTHKSTGELMSRLTNDVALIQGAYILVGTLTANALSAGQITVDGTGTDDTFTFNETVQSTDSSVVGEHCSR